MHFLLVAFNIFMSMLDLPGGTVASPQGSVGRIGPTGYGQMLCFPADKAVLCYDLVRLQAS